MLLIYLTSLGPLLEGQMMKGTSPSSSSSEPSSPTSCSAPISLTLNDSHLSHMAHTSSLMGNSNQLKDHQSNDDSSNHVNQSNSGGETTEFSLDLKPYNLHASPPRSSCETGSMSSSVSSQPLMPLRMPLPSNGGINEPQECPYCRRTFSCYYSLKRHFQDKHEQSDTLYVCEFCHRRYRTKNSLTTHKSLQHRGTSGMLKRLLKTSMKNVLQVPHAAGSAANHHHLHHHHHHQQHQQQYHHQQSSSHHQHQQHMQQQSHQHQSNEDVEGSGILYDYSNESLRQ